MPDTATSPVLAPSNVLAVLHDLLHEMSQPLGVLRCGMELAQMRQADGQRDLALWLQQVNQLSALFGTLRQLVDIESRSEPGPCDVAGLVRAIVIDLRPQAESRGVSLRLESPGPLRALASDERMRDVFQAVFAHAVERAGAGQQLGITLCAVDAEAWISISGLRPQLADWQEFDGCGAKPRAKPIWPLVLARCAVERAGGMIQFDFAGGDGTLLIRLPLARS